MGDVVVIELVRGPGAAWGAVRDWASATVRTGDAFVTEGTRMFLVLVDVARPELPGVIRRLREGAAAVGADAVHRPEGSDDTVDSLLRRARAGILPVQRRR